MKRIVLIGWLAIAASGAATPIHGNVIERPETQISETQISEPQVPETHRSEAPAAAPPPLGLSLDGLEAAVAVQIGSLGELTRSIVLDPQATPAERAEAMGELAQLLHAYDLREPAESAYRYALERAPRDFRWPYLLAHLLQTAGELEEAARLYEKALAIEADVPPALVRLARVYRELGRPEAAERNLRQALRLDSANSAALADLGELYLDQERPEEAIEILELALRMEPEANRLYYPLAMAYRARGELGRARELLARSGPVGIRPADPLVDGLAKRTTGERVHLLRGRAAFGAERFEEAAAEFRSAVEAAPDSVSARVNLGAALGALGRRQEAIEEFERAVELAPANATALFNLGTLHRAEGDLERSLHYLREAVLYASDDPGLRYELAEALRVAGRPDEAVAHYRQAITAAPPNERARLGLAQAEVARGRYAEARRLLEESLAQLPASGGLSQALARLLASVPDGSLRDGARAVALAERVFEARPTAYHAETLALALAEAGRCTEAATWQERYLEAVAGGDPSAAPDRGLAALERYRAGAPCRPQAGSADGS